MKPENLIPDFSSEKMPSMPRPDFEHLNELSNPESGIEVGAESYEQRAEARAVIADVGMTTAPLTPMQVDFSSTNDVEKSTISDVPLLANDDDVIEKEWVDKAKKIISETKDNPYKREEEVGKLQVDYISKRYGRSLGSSE